MVRIDRPHQPDTARELDLAGITQQLPGRAQNDRQLARIDVEALDQRLRLRIGLGVQSLTRMAVAREKALEAEHIAARGIADDHRPAGSGLEQTDATQDQGAHDALPELRVGDQQRAEPVRRNDQGVYRFERVGIHQSPPARQLRQFAQERAGAVADDRRTAAGLIVLGDVDLPGQDDDQAVAHLADLGQRLPHAVGAHHAEPTHPLDLGCLQGGEHLVASRVEDRRFFWDRHRHSRLASGF